jgi:hypothetical protein
MFRIARSPLSTLALILLLTPSIAGCSSTQRVQFNSVAPLNHATGVTMLSGSNISFRESGASVSNDTLYALGLQGQLKVPADSIAQIRSRKFSPGRTVGLLAGLALAGTFIAGAIAFDNSSFFHSR